MACALCDDTGWRPVDDNGTRRVVRCECWRDGVGRQRLADANIPRRYQHCTLENFAAYNESLERAVAQARLVVESFPVVSRGLFLEGQPGVGKTHLAVATLRRLLLEKGVPCLFCDVQDLLRQLQATFDRQSGMSELDLLQPVLATEVALLDDLGGRQFSPWVEETLSYIVTTRYNENRATLVTTNYMDDGPDELGATLKARIGPRVHSRLYEMCHPVRVKAEDFRIAIKRADHYRSADRLNREQEAP